MSGVSVGGTSEPSVNTKVLLEILGSSESVQARIADFQAAKIAAEAAFEQLKIGKDAKAAYDDANAKHAEAASILEKAKTDADAGLSTLSDAHTKAQQILAEAEALKAKTLADIEKERTEHQAWIDQSMADIAEQKQVAASGIASAEMARVQADEACKAAENAKVVAMVAADASSAAEADFKKKAAKLAAALDHIAPGDAS